MCLQYSLRKDFTLFILREECGTASKAVAKSSFAAFCHWARAQVRTVPERNGPGLSFLPAWLRAQGELTNRGGQLNNSRLSATFKIVLMEKKRQMPGVGTQPGLRCGEKFCPKSSWPDKSRENFLRFHSNANSFLQ